MTEAANQTEPQTEAASDRSDGPVNPIGADAGAAFTPVTSTLRKSAALRSSIIAIVSVILGLWGIYDYGWSIPAQQEQADRAAVATLTRSFLVTSLDGRSAEGPTQFEDRRARALAAITNSAAAHAATLDSGADLSQATQQLEQLKTAVINISAGQTHQWSAALTLFKSAVDSHHAASRQLTSTQQAAWELTEPIINAFQSVTPPAAYDRPVQWMFILCLPFGLYYGWVFITTSRRKYRLSERGELHLPGMPAWQASDVADIDMSKWMAKSVAWVQHRDGHRVKLDDHLYRDLHAIIGQFAARLHPEKWNVDARPVEATAAVDPDKPAEQLSKPASDAPTGTDDK